MSETKIGIGDIGIYVPKLQMDVNSLIEARAQAQPQLNRVMRRAAKKTGQVSFRFPAPWEDTATLAANAASETLERLSPKLQEKIRYILVGTETAIDLAKPVASYVHGMLKKAGYTLGNALSTYDTKHACAGGTSALLSAASNLSCSGSAQERGLVISSDIARYDAPSTAEFTQGAGSVALIVEKNPRLMEINLETQGFFSSDVDDFFRPINSVTAKVKGRYSMNCYQSALKAAFEDYCNRAERNPSECVEEIDYIALHVPFPSMPEIALRNLLSESCGKSEAEIEHFIQRSGFTDAMYLCSTFGNLYTASLYTYLATLLYQEHHKIGEEIIHKRVLIASYGSGNTMTVFSGTICENAPELISQWSIEKWRDGSRNASFDEYLAWLSLPTSIDALRERLETPNSKKGLFYLKSLSENGYRIYDRD
ncbi:Hydroxymethylglutaryl-CoA synthase [Olavius algarvensis spirochete endosymbiont]|uniref:hydroxymethylglutaryl-CoA synthase family protein n=1 Tax=Olavius algarvensis spirochete endosymbiont TaxID=260710 RepID=UPI000F24FB40|nr:hydroxymethylglutaryl-CoA synthase [Olavius algarvensis spirochete endosymbiont]VDA99748.1 Hydroxymethylglutaryl-CoA synthase [Olavius algarvensis spirochete endosymbiont]